MVGGFGRPDYAAQISRRALAWASGFSFPTISTNGRLPRCLSRVPPERLLPPFRATRRRLQDRRKWIARVSRGGTYHNSLIAAKLARLAPPAAERQPRDQWRQAAVAGGVVDRARVECLAQPAVGLAERVIRQSRQQMVERVVAQTDRRPQRR